MARFTELAVWKKSGRLSAEVYKVRTDLKVLGFCGQSTCIGLSIYFNIAEGHECGTGKKIVNFLNYAKGSAGEFGIQIYDRHGSRLH